MLRALIYQVSITNDSYFSLGAVSKTNLKNTFRLREFFPGMMPIADLYYNGHVARVQPVAPLEPYCEGRAPVPNIYGRDINSARKLLVNYGWQPSEGAADSNDSTTERLNDEGIHEVSSCSGTGFGFCSFDYQREGEILLFVTTMGDDFTVTDYAATCPKE